MLKLMTDMPADVLGIEAEGKVSGTDYETVMIPAVENILKNKKKVRMIYHLGDSFTGFELSAMVDDAKLGMKHLSSWEKIAMVSDHHLINTLTKFFGYMLSCEVRLFSNAELDKAKQWITES